mmetsp:Transcript_22505/g.57377  ORF Transcript_22505/g.57377 Transcript_22505/m.57377 type:complete len:211 (+) Transcript_22505:125-757(+)
MGAQPHLLEHGRDPQQQRCHHEPQHCRPHQARHHSTRPVRRGLQQVRHCQHGIAHETTPCPRQQPVGQGHSRDQRPLRRPGQARVPGIHRRGQRLVLCGYVEHGLLHVLRESGSAIRGGKIEGPQGLFQPGDPKDFVNHRRGVGHLHLVVCRGVSSNWSALHCAPIPCLIQRTKSPQWLLKIRQFVEGLQVQPHTRHSAVQIQLQTAICC